MRPRRAFGERLLKLAMLSHPRSFRREYRDEMLEYYRETCRREGRGPGWRMRFLLASFAAAAREGRRQRLATRQDRVDRSPRGGGMTMTGIATDIRHAWRRVAARRVASALAAAMLALAIGVTTAMFTVMDALLLRPLPFPEVDRLAHVVVRTNNTVGSTVSPAVFLAWRTSGLFERVEGAHGATVELDVAATIAEREAAFVTPGVLSMLGARPLLGRLFTDGEGAAGADEGVILAERLWRSAFGADASLVGRRVRVDDRSLVVVGVLPDAFRFPEWNTEIWRPMDYDVPPPALAGAAPSAYVLFKEGAPRDDALGRALALAREADPALIRRPGMDASMRADVWSIAGLDPGAYLARASPFLAGAVVLVFLVLCANVASLLLAQVSGRAREFGICAALGASRTRLLRQAFTESVVLGVLGFGAGIGAAWALVAIARRWLPDAFLLQTLNPIDVDGRALAVASSAALVAIGAVATLPAWVGTRGAGAGGAAGAPGELRGGTESKLARACTRALLVTEIALGTALLTGTALLVASFVRLSAVERGLDVRGVVTASVQPAEGLSLQSLEDAVGVLPGIAATTTSAQNFSHYGDGFVPDTPGGTGVEIWTSAQSVPPDYFAFYGIRLARGRPFDPSEAPSNVIVSQRFADAMWPGVNPLGRSFRFYRDRYEVIGVAEETRFPSLDRRRDLAELYLPMQPRRGRVTVHLRCDPPCDNFAVLRRRLLATSLVVDVSRLEAPEQRFAAELARPRAAATLALVFTAIAVLAAAGGLLSVLSYAVGRRRREFGIRAALGARPLDVQAVVFREGARLAVAGVCLGAAVAWGLGKLLASVVYDVSASEPIIWLLVTGVIGGTTMIACWIPARHAASVDPSTLLRDQ